MTKKEERKQRKEKKHKLKAKSRILARRTELRALAKEAQALEASRKHFEQRLFPFRKDQGQQPIVTMEEEPTEKFSGEFQESIGHGGSHQLYTEQTLSTAVEPKMSEQMPMDDARKHEWVMKKLEQNRKILEALEQELETETSVRNAVKQNLEDQGASTLRSQMDLIAQTAEDITKGKSNPKKGAKRITGKSKVQVRPNEKKTGRTVKK